MDSVLEWDDKVGREHVNGHEHSQRDVGPSKDGQAPVMWWKPIACSKESDTRDGREKRQHKRRCREAMVREDDGREHGPIQENGHHGNSGLLIVPVDCPFAD